jgi:hypothetical protein
MRADRAVTANSHCEDIEKGCGNDDGRECRRAGLKGLCHLVGMAWVARPYVCVCVCVALRCFFERDTPSLLAIYTFP